MRGFVGYCARANAGVIAGIIAGVIVTSGRSIMRSRTGRWAVALVLSFVLTLACGPKVKPGLGVTGRQADGALRPADGGGGRAWPRRRRSARCASSRRCRAAALAGRAHAGLRSRRSGCRARRASRWRCRPGRSRSTGSGCPRRSAGRSRPSVCAVSFPRTRRRSGPRPTRRWPLVFNQPVRARDIEKRCGYASDAGRVAAVLDGTGEATERAALPGDAAAAAGAGHALAVRVQRAS